MKTNKLIFLCIVVVIAAILIVTKVTNKPQKTQNSIPSQTTENVLSPQTNSQGSVSITATPKVLEKGKVTQFDITFTTHTGSLDFDLLQVAKLTDDKTTTYKPTSWSGGKGGHHLEGTLVFPTINQEAKRITLTLTGIDGTDRILSWEVNN